MAELNLLPRKEFHIIFGTDAKDESLRGLTVKGRFTTWALKKFCISKGIDLVDYLLDQSKRLNKYFDDVKAANDKGEDISLIELPRQPFDDIVSHILCAVESKSKEDKKGFAYSDFNVCAWIDEMGSDLYQKLLVFMGSDLDEQSNEPVKDEEKKSS